MSGGVAIILAGGSGRRMQQPGADKVLLPLLGKPAIHYSLQACLLSGEIDRWVIVVRDDEQRAKILAHIEACLPKLRPDTIRWVPGGTERQDSVLAALDALEEKEALVFIHDGARPLITADSIRAVAAAAKKDGAAVLAHPVADTIKQVPSPGESVRIKPVDLDRSRLWAMETPQVFRCGEIGEAHQAVRQKNLHVTDDAAAYIANGGHISLIENHYENRKLTVAGDVAVIEALLRNRA